MAQPAGNLLRLPAPSPAAAPLYAYDTSAGGWPLGRRVGRRRRPGAHCAGQPCGLASAMDWRTHCRWRSPGSRSARAYTAMARRCALPHWLRGPMAPSSGQHMAHGMLWGQEAREAVLAVGHRCLQTADSSGPARWCPGPNSHAYQKSPPSPCTHATISQGLAALSLQGGCGCLVRDNTITWRTGSDRRLTARRPPITGKTRRHLAT